MMARSFRSVGWVAAIGSAALGCYMLSLNVASERAALAKVQWQIVSTRQDIRELQTELGTRGRMAQLEQWNAQVLALSAPTAGQFLDNQVMLARFDQREKPIAPAEVHMASLDTTDEAKAKTPAPIQAVAPAPARPDPSLVHQASYVVADATPLQRTKPAVLLDEKLVKGIGETAKTENTDKKAGGVTAK